MWAASCGGHGRGPAPACPAIWKRCISGTVRPSSKAISCSRSTSGRSERLRAGQGQSGAREVQRHIHRGRNYARAQQLLRDRTISEQVFDQRAQANRNAQASVTANEALVKQAELDLEFTELRAPISGRIGDRRVTEGNLVTGGTAGNTRCSPPWCRWIRSASSSALDESAYLRYERLSSGGKDITSREASVMVGLKLIDERDFAHRGYMDFVDNVIDRGSAPFAPARSSPIQIVCSRPHVRARARAGLTRLCGAAGAGWRYLKRAGAQICARRRRRERRRASAM